MNRFFQQFGGSLTNALTAQYAQSANWKNGAFQNLEPTNVTGKISDFPRIIYRQLTTQKGQMPTQPLPVAAFRQSAFLQAAEKSKFVWYGHSAVLMRMRGKTLLIDPMLGPDTTPIAPIATKRFSENVLDFIDDFPPIDVVLITHDHYDHLDYDSIQKLKATTKQYFVALGVKRHLVSWGIAADLITEFDWWQSNTLDDIKITFTPTRHFSGRGLTNRMKSLWGGWVFENEKEKIWFSGDGGYGQHFKEIGKRLGGFDFAFMECGQYNDDWPQIHLFPSQAVQAAIDAGAKKAMPVHWGGFALSYQHTWYQPPENFVEHAQQQRLNYALPPLGQLFQADTELTLPWWHAHTVKSN